MPSSCLISLRAQTLEAGPGGFETTLFCLILNNYSSIVLTVMLRTSQLGETGLGPHAPSKSAGICNQLLSLLLLYAFTAPAEASAVTKRP